MKKNNQSKASQRIFIPFIFLLFSFILLWNINAVSADTALTPYVLSNGVKSDTDKERIYNISSDGTDLIRLNIPQDGALKIRIASSSEHFVIAEVYKNGNASDLPHYLKTDCTSDLWTTGFVIDYFEKGTYYLRLPKGDYRLGMVEYPIRKCNLKAGTSTAAYCDYQHGNTYTFKAASNGYIMLTKTDMETTDGTMTAVLCDKKGMPLTESCIFSQTQNNKIIYAVKKGNTYKIKLKALNVNDIQCYQLTLKYTSLNEKSGSSKSKAVSVKFGNKISGMILAEDSATKADWYKIKNPKKQELVLNYSGSITSGSLIIDVYDTKGKKLDSYSVISNIGEKKEDLLHNKDGGTKMPEGTYYLKVTKSRKTSTGIYSFSLFGR